MMILKSARFKPSGF